MNAERPWLAHYGSVPPTLSYPDGSVWDAVSSAVARNPDAVAYDFLGTTATYAELARSVERLAAALAAEGLRAGDRITISLPTSPQGVIAFYAAARLGAVASLIHPLSTPAEIEGFLVRSNSRLAVTLDAFYGAFAEVRDRTPLETLILTKLVDSLPVVTRAGFWLKVGRKIPRVPADAPVKWWSTLLDGTHPDAASVTVAPADLAAILYSGGSTGSPKGIMLSHRNFTAEAMELGAWIGLTERDVILAVLPIFHGFGLGALIHAPLLENAKLLLVPRYSPEEVARVIRTKRPTLMAGVPTLYDSLARDRSLQTADLSCLRAAFCGADTLPRAVKERFEGLVRERGGTVHLLEGYGLTEAVTAVVGSPLDGHRDGTAGLPFPDTLVEICEIGTLDALPPGQEGEICISGPAVMIGYLDDPEATAAALREHADGRTWLHTGDIGRMDDDGFLTFVTRLKRMIKSSGFNVFPAEVEAVLCEHPAVAEACVVGIPDESQGERVTAFVVTAPGVAESPDLAGELIAHCRGKMIKWSCPRSVEFLSELPRTRLGKIDFITLASRGVPVADAVEPVEA